MPAQVPGSGTAGEPLNILFGRTAATNVPDFESTFYDALQVKLNRRFANGFSMTTSYAFGKSIDYLAGSSGLNNLNLALNKGLADWDRRHIFTYSGTYELPFGPGKKGARSGPAKIVAGGWQLTGLWTWESGLPLDIVTSATSLNANGLTNRPNLIAPVQILGHTGPGQYWFSTSSFANPAPLTFGNVGRNILAGPHLFNIDFSLVRKFRITERVNLEFDASAFNLSNTPWFDRPDVNMQDAAFGQVTTAQGNQSVKVNMNRSLQLSVRLAF